MPRTSEDASQNSQEFTVVDHSGFVEAAASFIYRSYLISFSTMGYNKSVTRNPVLVIANKGNSDNTQRFDTVESAIANIDSWINVQNPS